MKELEKAISYYSLLNKAVTDFVSTHAESRPNPDRIRNRFEYPISFEDATKLLAQAYSAEVEKRGYTYAEDAATAQRLAAVAKWLTSQTR